MATSKRGKSAKKSAKDARKAARPRTTASRDTNLQSRWEGLLAELAAGAAPADISGLVQSALRESYLETNKDLQFFAAKVRFYNEVKKRVREEIARARKHRAALAERMDEQVGADDLAIEAYTTRVFATFPSFDDEGTATVEVSDGESIDTRGELEAYIENLEDQLSTVGDDAQLANIDLQNMLQKAQQLLQMMSNLSKTLHDTAMAIIRKIG